MLLVPVPVDAKRVDDNRMPQLKLKPRQSYGIIRDCEVRLGLSVAALLIHECARARFAGVKTCETIVTRPFSLSFAPFKLALLFSFMAGIVNPVLASDVRGVSDAAQPIRLGGGNLYLSGQIRYLMDDNKNRSRTDPRDISGVVLSPAAVFQADQGSLDFQASYEGGYATLDDSNFDFEDHVAAVSVGSTLSKRLRVGADASYIQRHDEFDEDVDVGTLVRDDLVVSQNTKLNAGLIYGAQNARGNVSAGLTLFSHKLDELDVDNSSVAPDYDLVEPAVELSLRVSQDTRFTIGFIQGLYDYENDNSDRSITRGLLGLQFSPTGKLQGQVRIGSAYTSYDTGVNPSKSNAIFNFAVTYRPVSYSRFILRAQRRLDNSDNSSIDFSGFGTTSDIYKLDWFHQWTPRIATDSYVSWVSTDRECPDSSTEFSSGGVKVIYSFLRSWTISFDVQQDSSSSSLCDTDSRDAYSLGYDRQKIDVILGYTL